MEKASKCLEMLHNWILKLFAMSSVLSATVCRVRLIFLKSFLYQDITLTDQTFFNKTPICDRLLIRSNQMWQHITFFHCSLNYRTKRLEHILLLIHFFSLPWNHISRCGSFTDVQTLTIWLHTKQKYYYVFGGQNIAIPSSKTHDTPLQFCALYNFKRTI
jgi:hypothetical protein